MEDHMCAFCGCDWSRVRSYLGVVRVALCNLCHRDLLIQVMALAKEQDAEPAEWVETPTASVN